MYSLLNILFLKNSRAYLKIAWNTGFWAYEFRADDYFPFLWQLQTNYWTNVIFESSEPTIAFLFFRLTSPQCNLERQNIHGYSPWLSAAVRGSQVGTSEVCFPICLKNKVHLDFFGLFVSYFIYLSNLSENFLFILI